MNLKDWLKIKATTEPSLVKSGQNSELILEVEIPKDSHIESHRPSEKFLIPTEVILDKKDGIAFGEVVYPKSHEKKFDWSDVILQVYSGKVIFRIPLLPEVEVRGEKTITGKIKYQGCTSTLCLPPNSQTFTASITVS